MDFLENFTRKFQYNCLQFPKYHTKECGNKTNFNFTSGASFLLELVGPFPSSFLPPFQNESLWKISYMKMSLICMKVDVRVKPLHVHGFVPRLDFTQRQWPTQKYQSLFLEPSIFLTSL